MNLKNIFEGKKTPKVSGGWFLETLYLTLFL